VLVAVKVAAQVLATSNFNESGFVVTFPQSPPQLVKVKPVVAIADKIAESPLVKVASQVVPQLMVVPAVTVPLVGGVIFNATGSTVTVPKLTVQATLVVVSGMVMLPSAQLDPQVTLVVGSAISAKTVPAGNPAVQLAPPAEVQLVRAVLGALTLPVPVTVTVTCDWVGVMTPVKVAVHAAGVSFTKVTVVVAPLPVQLPLQLAAPEAVRVTVPGSKEPVQVISLAEVQLLIPAGELLAIEPLPTTVTFNVDLPGTVVVLPVTVPVMGKV